MTVERTLRRAALVTALCASAGCNMIYGPTSPDREWTVHDTTRFSIFVRPGSFAETAAPQLGEILEDQYTHTVAVFGLSSAGRISMFLYNSGAEINPPLPADRSGVAFPETNAVHAVCVPPLDDSLMSLLTHEANHVIVQGGLGRAGTSFMNEGLASALISERHGRIGPTLAHGWCARNRMQLPRLVDLVDDGKWNSSSSAGYKSSASFLAYLLDRYGLTRLRQLYYARSPEFANRTSEIYGRPLEALETEWLAFIADVSSER